MKIESIKTLCHTKYIDLLSATYEDKNGKSREWVYADRPHDTRAVMIVPVINPDKDPKLVVIKEFRVPIGGVEWGFAAGLVENKEDPKETAIRELKEECGLNVVRFIRPISPYVYNSPGMCSESIAIAYVEASGDITNKHLEESEEIETMFLGRREIKIIMEGAIIDNSIKIGAKAWFVFQRFVEEGRV
jgi:ADP-ribose pyrophosphatase